MVAELIDMGLNEYRYKLESIYEFLLGCLIDWFLASWLHRSGRILNYFVLGRSHIPLSLRGRNVIVAFSGAYSRFPQFPQDSSSFGEEEHSAGSVLVFQKPGNTAVLETQISKLHWVETKKIYCRINQTMASDTVAPAFDGKFRTKI